MISQQWTTSISFLVASVLWACLGVLRLRRLVRTKGEVVGVRNVRRGRGIACWPVVRFPVAGEYREVEIRENGSFQVGSEVEVLYAEGDPGRATFRPRVFLGPMILLLVSLLFAIAALS